MFFSIIVPIYQVEPYLRTCIESVLNQDFMDYELILVDDGSPDQCPAICDEYAMEDPKIQVIHKPNGGLVSARQAGVKAAQGKYVMNLDGDDWLEQGALRNVFEAAEETNADMISFGYYVVANEKSGKSQIVKEKVDPGLYRNEKRTKELFPKILMDIEEEHLIYFLCTKAIKRENIVKSQLKVNLGISYGEDVACVIPLYLKSKSICILDQALYNYRFNAASFSNHFNVEKFHSIQLLLEHLEKIVEYYPKLRPQLDRYAACCSFWTILNAADAGAKGSKKRMKEYMSLPIFRNHISKATFKKQSMKNRIAFTLMKWNWIGLTYEFLAFTEKIKKRIRN